VDGYEYTVLPTVAYNSNAIHSPSTTQLRSSMHAVSKSGKMYTTDNLIKSDHLHVTPPYLGLYWAPASSLSNIKHNLLLIFQHNRVFSNLRKTQHQNREFGPKPGEIPKKTCKTSTLAFNAGGGGVETQKCSISFC